MSDYDWLDDDDDASDDGPANSTKALQQARAAAKAKSKENKDLLERLERAESALRERSVKDAIKSKGLPEKVAGLIPKDLTTSEEVDAWVTEYADIFGVPAVEGDPADGQAATQQDPQMEALQRMAAMQAGGQPFSNDPAQQLALIKSSSDPAALNKLLFGNELGPQVV